MANACGAYHIIASGLLIPPAAVRWTPAPRFRAASNSLDKRCLPVPACMSICLLVCSLRRRGLIQLLERSLAPATALFSSRPPSPRLDRSLLCID